MAPINDAASQVNPDPTKVVDSTKVWTTLITNTAYLSGLLTLDYSLKKSSTKYPLIALYTDAFPEEGHKALDIRRIPKKRIPYLLPTKGKDYSNDPRFYDCWSKLTPFSLTEYERVVQLDSDMLVLKNMDNLMDLELDAPELGGKGNRVFAASHACVCNPLKKPHYPKDWIPTNCAFTSQHSDPSPAQSEGAPSTAGLAMPNGGLQVVNPSDDIYNLITERMSDETVMSYDFADQSLLGDLFYGRWVALPYVYNALKTLRWKGVHSEIWRDEEVRNVHYILSPKPWDEEQILQGAFTEADAEVNGKDCEKAGKEGKQTEERDETHAWWWKINEERKKHEKARGVDDGF